HGALRRVEWVRVAVPVRVEAERAVRAGAMRFPAVPGMPHPGRRAEQALEAALAPLDWAAGREWNRTYQSHPLSPPIRVELMWPAERCAVQVDGPEHRERARFAADRQRDVRLQLDGFAVLRFPDFQVMADIETVVGQIGQLLRNHREAD
ncbi:DUF559 domain-containing protein, partial [Nonomuraea sp. NN258]|uniref:DUF559 domain-containing protein n=1 Tax=Nonomuraea antri TaxID=2730852 RepID=UPI0015695DD8